MVLILDGSSEHGATNIEYIRYFNLLKTFGYIERVVNHTFFGKDIDYRIRAPCYELPSYVTWVKQRE